MNKRQKILRAMMETARAKTAKGTDLRDVREAVRQTRDDALAAWRHGIMIDGVQGTEGHMEDNSPTDIPVSTMMIGNKRVLLDDINRDDFIQGYDDGYERYYHTTQRDIAMLDSYHLLFHLRNGWDDSRSDMYNTGFQVGWLAVFFEQEEGQLARTRDVGGTDAETHEQHTETV